MKNNGFTLVEVVVVIVILSILATMLIPRMTGFLTKGKDEQNWEDAKNILESAQVEFYKLYAINNHDNNSMSIVTGVDNRNQVVNPVIWPGKTKPEEIQKYEDIKIHIASISNKKTYNVCLDLFKNIGYKLTLDNNGRWQSDVPNWVVVITGDYSSYCDPSKDTYNPEKAYTVYGLIFNKNSRGDFFILLRDGTVKYPRNPEEFDNIIYNIVDENEPDKILLKEMYILKADWPDSRDSKYMWDYFHNNLNTNEGKLSKLSYSENGKSKYDNYR